MHVLRPIATRPNVRVSAKKTDFVSPTEAPGEGNRRFPSMDQGPDEPIQKVNPIKKFLMDVFKIKEIDYGKFRKENKWAIRPRSKD
jgi:hypothetical protein